MSDYSTAELGPIDTWNALEDPIGMTGKLFLEGPLGADNAGVSVNGMPAGSSSPFWHLHTRLEEIYIFLGGEGRMALGDDVVDVKAGTAVRVPPNTMMAVHANADSPTDLRFICVRSGPGSLADMRDDAEFSREPFPWS